MRDRLKYFSWVATPLLLCLTTLSLPEILYPSVASAQEATIGDRQAEAERLFKQGREQFGNRQFQEAAQSFQQVIEIYRELGDHIMEAAVLIKLGETYYGLQQYPQAIKSYQQALTISQTLSDRNAEVDLLIRIGSNYYRLQQYSQALESYQQALTLSREIKDFKEEVRALNRLAMVYGDLKQVPKVIDAYKQALVALRNLGDSEEEIRTLSKLANLYRDLEQYPKVIEVYQQSLALSHATGDRQAQVDALFGLGDTYWRLNQQAKAIEFYEQVPAVFQNNSTSPAEKLHQRQQEANVLKRLGSTYLQLKEYSKAIKVYQQLLAIGREIGRERSNQQDIAAVDLDNFFGSTLDTELEALINLSVLSHLVGQSQAESEFRKQALAVSRNLYGDKGEFYVTYRIAGMYNYSLGRYSKAIELYQQALTLTRTLGNRRDEMSALSELGRAYLLIGPYQKAIESYQKVTEIYESLYGDIHPGDTGVLLNVGMAYYHRGQYAEAIRLYEQVIDTSSDTGDGGFAKVNARVNLGVTYHALGQYQKAINSYQQALTFFQNDSYRSKFNVATTLDKLGMVYQSLGQHQTALESYQQALGILQKDEDARNETAMVLDHLGVAYQSLGQTQQAIESHQQALAIFGEISNRGGEASALNHLGEAHHSLGQYDQAITFYQQSLAIKQEIGDQAGEGITLNNIGTLLAKQNQPELAIVFFKQSVNVRESIRSNIRGLSQELQQSYTETVADDYRRLADLLLQQNRVLEAQRVLDLLKVQELDDYLRDVRGNEQTAQGVELLPQERRILELYDQAIARGQELKQLRTIPYTELPSKQQQRLDELVAFEQETTVEWNKFIQIPEVATALQELNRTTEEQNVRVQQFRDLQDNLQNLQQNAVLLYPLILEKRLELVLVTPDSPPIRRTVMVDRAKLNEAIVTFRQALENPNSDAVTPAQQLYKWLIQPLEADLKAANAKTLIYAPDGALRYIPLAALHDGNQWLAQRLRINHITAASIDDLNLQPQPQLSVLAAAFSQGSAKVLVGDREISFSGLPFAGTEVENLAAIIPNTTKLLDQEFSRNATVAQMNSKTVVHLATHAGFVPGQPEQSFILFGNGERVNLEEVKAWTLNNVDLFVLSACETGVGEQLGDGREVLGFGYLMEQAGARAAVASLWSVSDGGTQALMNAFYTALENGMSKAEALRQAQIALITKDLSAVGGSRGEEAWIEVVSARTGLPLDVSNNLSHPYYWAPFILIGNGL